MVQGIQFNEYRQERIYERKESKMIQWVMQISGGRLKNEDQAAIVSVAVAIIALLISLILFLGLFSEPTRPAGEGDGNMDKIY